MPSKKTGIYLSPIANEIVNRVMQDFGYTKISNALNFIVLEYDKLTKKDKKEVTEVKEEVVKPTNNLLDWFVAEDNT